MTIVELIEHLKKHDPNTRVFTKGYEGGLEDAKLPDFEVKVCLNVNKDWYYGPHEMHKDTPSPNKYETVKGVIL